MCPANRSGNAGRRRNSFARRAEVKDPRFAEHLATFVEVVRGGSFSGVARRRGMTPSAIVRQVDALEASLGIALLVRSTRAVTPTDAGERLMRRGRRLLDDLDDVYADVASLDGTVAGVLRLACSPTFGKRHVLPVVTELLARHPDLRVELSFEERPYRPVVERHDVVIRIGDLEDTGLVGMRLATQRRVLVAAPSYLDAAPPLARTTDLAEHHLVEELSGSGYLGWSDLTTPRTHRARYRSDDYEAMRAAALAGVGVALMPDWVVGNDVLAGRLRRVDLVDPAGERWRDAGVPITLLRAPRKPPSKVQALIDLLRETIGSPPHWTVDDV